MRQLTAALAAGAVFGGFAMVLVLSIPAREWFGLKDLITHRHIENMAKIMLGTGMIVAYAYSVEFFTAWYSHHHYEQFVFLNRPLGPYWWAFWIMVSCNVITPQLFWFKKVRENHSLVWIICIFVNVGMWFERFVIAVTSLTRDFVPSSWGYFSPTWVDITMFIGSFGLFFTVLQYLQFVVGMSPLRAAAALLPLPLVMIPLAWIIEGPITLNLAPATWLAIGYYAIIATAVAYLLYYRVLALAGSGNLMLVTLTVAPVAIILGAVTLGEALPLNAYVGFGILALGLIILDGRLLSRLKRP